MLDINDTESAGKRTMQRHINLGLMRPVAHRRCVLKIMDNPRADSRPLMSDDDPARRLAARQ
jgi:hypothetical protein